MLTPLSSDFLLVFAASRATLYYAPLYACLVRVDLISRLRLLLMLPQRRVTWMARSTASEPSSCPLPETVRNLRFLFSYTGLHEPQ